MTEVLKSKCPVCGEEGEEYKRDWQKFKYFYCGEHRWITAANGKLEKVLGQSN